MFLGFLLFQLPKNSELQVLKVISPTEIVVDLDKNGNQNDDEIISLENIESFSTKPSELQSKLANKLKISQEDAIGLGFLAECFAKETLEGKKVKVENNKKIIIDNKNYETLILNQGLAIKSGEKEFISPLMQKNLEKVRKLNLVILNNKNYKYHKLTCKYGLKAHNSQLLPASQLPKEAKPCKFCLVKHYKNSKPSSAKGSGLKYRYHDEIPNIKSPPTVFRTNSIKIFLTDLTTTLKPSKSCNSQVCRALLDEINSAQSSIDFAIYGYTQVPEIHGALARAQKRGVKIRMVYDSDENNDCLYLDTLHLTKFLTNNKSDKKTPFMHNKFFIFDNKTVLTGSANISNTDMSGYNTNSIILINSEKVANIYEQEFEQMYEGKFYKQKVKIPDKEAVLDGADFHIYFSPKDNTIADIIPLIDNAQKYIYMPVFLITHTQLTESLIRASKRGVAVKVILDATKAHGSYAKHKLLRQNGVLVKTENYAGKVHSKSIIIDDTYTIMGSMNFSRSGETTNDENLIIIKNRDIALFYKKFFQYLWIRIPDYWLTHNARSESPDSIGSCSDGIDNDFDKKTDMEDDSCRVLKKH